MRTQVRRDRHRFPAIRTQLHDHPQKGRAQTALQRKHNLVASTRKPSQSQARLPVWNSYRWNNQSKRTFTWRASSDLEFSLSGIPTIRQLSRFAYALRDRVEVDLTYRNSGGPESHWNYP